MHGPAVTQAGFTTMWSTVEYGASPLGVERDAQIRRAEPVGSDLLQEVDAVGRRKDDVAADQRP